MRMHQIICKPYFNSFIYNHKDQLGWQVKFSAKEKQKKNEWGCYPSGYINNNVNGDISFPFKQQIHFWKEKKLR